MKHKETISNQVFIGCPFKGVRTKYESIIDGFQKKYPLSFIIIGRDPNHKAEDLLGIIKQKLIASSWAIFDASGGNANVSLEYGFAEAKEIPRAIYITKHGASKKTPTDSAIIADLAGKTRNEYKQINELKKKLDQFCMEHSYTKRFENIIKKETSRLKKGKKKSARTLVLKIIHYLDGKDTCRRADLVSEMLGLVYPEYSEQEVDGWIKKLNHKLITCTAGRHSEVSIK